jgi:SnoaL-like domain
MADIAKPAWSRTSCFPFIYERSSMSVSDPSAPSTSPVSTAITALRAAGERGDADAVAELLAPDVVFHSPITERIRFEGKEEVAALHRDIFAVLEDIDTTEPLALGDLRSFSFRARVRGVELEAMNLVRFNEQAQIVDYKVLVRPLPGLATLFAALPPRVSARRRGRLRGALVFSLARPLAFVLRTADRLTPSFL